MRFERGWLPFAAIAAVAMLLAEAFAKFPIVSQSLLVLTVLSSIGAIIHYIRVPKDPFDLGELRRIDEAAELQRLDVPDLDQVEEVFCLHCGEGYSTRFPICPRCKRSP